MKIGKILRRVLTLLWQWLKHVPWALYMLLVFSVIPDSYTSLRPTWAKRGRSEVRSGKEVSLDDLKGGSSSPKGCVIVASSNASTAVI
mmetsp:Transcript_12156/g.10131  ORF Transcript_12156/g.10131 Transcript_12156/m.10131 type:complete len:88 (+) Transcript_12156:193-456(+)